jgi:hypothetical protein
MTAVTQTGSGTGIEDVESFMLISVKTAWRLRETLKRIIIKQLYYLWRSTQGKQKINTVF